MSEAVLFEVDGGVATLSFNRPHVLNAMDGETMVQFRAAAERAQKDEAVRVLVIGGEGNAFVAGGDVSIFRAHLHELDDLIMRWGREMHFAIQALRRMDKPVLASVHGACAGAGFSVLCACDLAIAADNAKFSLAYTNLGTSPDGGSSFFLPRLVGYKKAMELVLLPDLFDALAARQLGLVNWVVPPGELAQVTARIAGRLAAGPTKAYAEAKHLLNRSLGESMETQMEEELFAFARCTRTHDLAEGVTAFVEKRKPNFQGK